MKKRLQIDSGILEFLLLIFLALAMMIYLNGCSAAALKLARDKASPENITYWKINGVESAARQENGDISVCVKLSGPDEDAEPELNTIILPFSILPGDTDTIKRLGLRSGKPIFDHTIYYWYPYWYPIEKTERGCQPADPGSPSAISILPVEKIRISHEDRKMLYNLLDSLSKDRPPQERVYELRVAFSEKDTQEETDTASSEVRDKGADDYGDTLFVYWPALAGQQDFQPIPIAGVYEDNSSRLYYLLVPLAFVGDVVAITTLVTLRLYLESMRY